jgi:hypothetical protein
VGNKKKEKLHVEDLKKKENRKGPAKANDSHRAHEPRTASSSSLLLLVSAAGPFFFSIGSQEHRLG